MASAAASGFCSGATGAVASFLAALLRVRFFVLAVEVALAVAAVVVVAVVFISLNFRGFVTCPEGLIEFLRCNIRERSESGEAKISSKISAVGRR